VIAGEQTSPPREGLGCQQGERITMQPLHDSAYTKTVTAIKPKKVELSRIVEPLTTDGGPAIACPRCGSMRDTSEGSIACLSFLAELGDPKEIGEPRAG